MVGQESAEVNMTKNLEVMKKLSFQDMSQEWHMFNPMTRRMITSWDFDWGFKNYLFIFKQQNRTEYKDCTNLVSVQVKYC